ncbi:MAG: glutathione S-transferase family protein [Pseudomonadota bacterium]
MEKSDHKFEVYHNPESLCSQKVRVAFAEKQLDYTSHVIELSDLTMKGENLKPAYRKINPNGIVPTLVHNGSPVYDSYEIIQYVDELLPQAGTKLWPDDPQKREELESWIFQSSLRNDQEIGATMGTSVAGLSAPLLSFMLKRQPILHVIKTYVGHPIRQRGFGFIMARIAGFPPSLLAKSRDGMAEGLIRVDRQLASHDGDWLLGEFSQVDISLMAAFHRLDDLHLVDVLDHPSIPNVGPYWRRLSARPSYASAIVDWHNPEIREAIGILFSEGNPMLQDLNDAVEKCAA